MILTGLFLCAALAGSFGAAVVFYRKRRIAACVAAAALGLGLTAGSAALITGIVRSVGDYSPNTDLTGRVRKIKLDNGMTFLMLDRGVAPVFSTQLKVKVGNIEEEPGASGLAHFFEHMAFKGTDQIGTTDFAAEKPLLDEVLTVGAEIARMKKEDKPPEAYAELVAKRRALESEENRLIVKNEYVSLFQRNGGADLNASTSNDFTTYYVSLPANKLEMWAYMESERLRNRVFREFFTEVDVVAEERRMRIDSTPDGRLYEAYMNLGFDASPYKRHPVGYARDIQTYEPQAAMDFYSRYYIPSRMVAVLVGHFDLDAAEKIIRKYFSRLPAKEDRPHELKPEPADAVYPRSVALNEDGQPRFYLGYKRPAYPHADDNVLDVVQDLMCQGRTSRLFKRLVVADRSVSQVTCYASIPGARLDSLFTFYATPLSGHSNGEVKKVIEEEIANMVREGPTPEELQIVKNRSAAELVYSLKSNDGLASTLAFYESLTGDWKYVYEAQARIRAMTGDDVKRVMAAYFTPAREVAAYLEPEK